MEDYLSILKQYWGYDDFRGIQRDIIESILSGTDTLGLMPTGGGKSITFQVPALCLKGTCIVITPLIALMKDQVQNLRRRGIRAAAIYSGLSREEIIITLENCILGGTKLLYVSPERLSSELFLTKLRHMRVSFITVDEAHCISQWGYDFRPSYLQIANIRKQLPSVPVLALTATATPAVVHDICDKLSAKEDASWRVEDVLWRVEGGGWRENSPAPPQQQDYPPSTLHPSPSTKSRFKVFRMSFERSNLAYIVRRAPDKREELIHILQSVKGCAIVYARSRRRTREVAEMLVEAGIGATFYHAGLDTATKDQRQTDWQNDRVRVMVATNAFGMGIDKPDVRIVLHIDCPSSLEAYFQEAGRAGRDGQKAYAVLLYNDADQQKLEKRISDTFPEKDYIKQVYEHLAYFYQVGVGSGYHATFEFNIDKFCHAFRHFPIQVDAALKILNRAGYIEYTEEQENQARVMFTVSRNDLYRLENNSPNEDKVITALLRNYGGLFVDYNFIDEGFIASQCQLQQQQVYLILKSLSQKHILHFIPQKKTPYVRYLQRREDMENVQIPPSVYEERKEQFRQRIHAMIGYATNDSVCRSRQLLSYFGQEESRDCGQCDVCLDPQHDRSCESILSQEAHAILELLADGKPHHITELRDIQLPSDKLDIALDYLMREEYIQQEDGFLSKN